jgi:hypothetical protein
MSDTLSNLLAFSITIAIGYLIAVAFYESLCRRDVLVARSLRFARRRSRRQWVSALAYVLAVGVGIPVLLVVWTVTLELSLVVVGSLDRLGNLALVATSIVAATRILAYVREKTAHELAKAIPLSLTILFLTGGTSHLEENLTSIVEDPSPTSLTDEMIVFLVVLEIGLRLLTDGTHALLAAIRARRGVESDLGAWRTLWAAIRRPLASTDAGPVEDRSAP